LAIIFQNGLKKIMTEHGPGTPPWYTFTNPISIVKEMSFVIAGIVCIYFSCRVYMEKENH